MNETYSDDIMLCYIQGFNNGTKNNGTRAIVNPDTCEDNNNVPKKKEKRVSLQLNLCERVEEVNSDITKYPKTLIKGNSIKLSVGDRARKLPVVKRSFSDRFSRITDVSGRRPKNILTIRKTWSTGNFPAGAAGGGCGAPRSAPATPLQLEPHPPRHVKAEKTHVVKPLSGSAPSVRVAALGGAEDATDEKQPYKSRQKKFQRHFPQVGPEERVLNYYSCALVGDLLLQGHLYITKNYFAFYSNVFGYVTKLLIPTTSVLRITKEKVARIIPNAVGVCTRDERHVFGSLLSRDSTYKLMTHVWKAARATEPDIPKSKDLRTDHEPSEYSPEDDSSSAGGDHHDAPAPPVRRESEAIITGSAAVIQPALLTGTTSPPEKPCHWRTFLIAATIVLSLSALVMAYRLFVIGVQTEDDIMGLSGDDLYEELVKYRMRLHGRAANEMHAFLTTNLLLLTKVRQSLEALSGVILSDLSRADDLHVDLDVPNDTAFS